jgi:hypothetical protein
MPPSKAKRSSVDKLDLEGEIARIDERINKDHLKLNGLRKKLGNMIGGLESGKSRSGNDRNRKIYKRYCELGKSRDTASSVAKEFGVHPSTVRRIIEKSPAPTDQDLTLTIERKSSSERTEESGVSNLSQGNEPDMLVSEPIGNHVASAQTRTAFKEWCSGLIDELEILESELRKIGARQSGLTSGDLFDEGDWREVFADKIHQLIEKNKKIATIFEI